MKVDKTQDGSSMNYWETTEAEKGNAFEPPDFGKREVHKPPGIEKGKCKNLCISKKICIFAVCS